jgi:TonB family protein
MGLVEFLRQWQRGRLAAGAIISLLLHGALIALLVGGGLPAATYAVKRGEPLMVELPQADDSPPPGLAGAPEPRPAAPPAVAPRPSPPAPKVASAPPAPAPKPAARPPAPRPQPVERAPRPEPERRVASAPPPAPEPEPAPAPVTPAAVTPPAPAPPADVTPQVERTPQERPAGERQLAALPPSQPGGGGAPDVLSALRRGQGGAGGRGQGRAGIEGEPIPLDSADPKYSDYLDQVRRRIKDKWGFPCVKNDATRQCEYKTTQLVLEFGIAKDGKVPFVTVVRSSGYPIYDDYAVNAVKLASPFPPIPDSFSKKGVPIHATFSYVVESSLANILR